MTGIGGSGEGQRKDQWAEELGRHVRPPVEGPGRGVPAHLRFRSPSASLSPSLSFSCSFSSCPFTSNSHELSNAGGPGCKDDGVAVEAPALDREKGRGGGFGGKGGVEVDGEVAEGLEAVGGREESVADVGIWAD